MQVADNAKGFHEWVLTVAKCRLAQRSPPFDHGIQTGEKPKIGESDRRDYKTFDRDSPIIVSSSAVFSIYMDISPWPMVVESIAYSD